MPGTRYHQVVQVEGLDALARSVGRIDRGLRRELQRQLRKVGDIVAEDARRVAEEKGLSSHSAYDKHPGLLIKSIRPSVRGGSVFIRDTARTPGSGKWGNYNYPARYEFENHGERAFLRVAINQNTNRIMNEMGHILDWIADEWGRA